jgi:hypothetical protein
MPGREFAATEEAVCRICSSRNSKAARLGELRGPFMIAIEND